MNRPTTTRTTLLAASLLALSLPGCVFVGPRSICRVWADWNTYAQCSLNLERLDHLPYRRPRVETLHWQYGVGPNGPEPCDADDLGPRDGVVPSDGSSCSPHACSPPLASEAPPSLPSIDPPAVQNPPSSPLRDVRPLLDPPPAGGVSDPPLPPPLAPMAYSVSRSSAAPSSAARAGPFPAPARGSDRAPRAPTGAWLFQGAAR